MLFLALNSALMFFYIPHLFSNSITLFVCPCYYYSFIVIKILFKKNTIKENVYCLYLNEFCNLIRYTIMKTQRLTKPSQCWQKTLTESKNEVSIYDQNRTSIKQTKEIWRVSACISVLWAVMKMEFFFPEDMFFLLNYEENILTKPISQR